MIYELAQRIGIEGFMHPFELDRLVELAAGKRVLEIGSFKGLSAWGMACVAKSVFCVDTFKANSAGQQQMEEYTTLADFGRAVERFKHVDFWVGSSAQAALSGISPEKLFDLIFIDAFHSYDETKADILRWLPRLREKGILALHDYGHKDFPGVKEAVDELHGGPADIYFNTVGTLIWLPRAVLAPFLKT